MAWSDAARAAALAARRAHAKGLHEMVKTHNRKIKRSKSINVTRQFAGMASRSFNPFSLITHINGKRIR